MDDQHVDPTQSCLLRVPLSNPKSAKMRRTDTDPWELFSQQIWREQETPWVRVPYLGAPSVILTASQASAELIWAGADSINAQPLRLTHCKQLRSAQSVYARVEALYIPSTSIYHPQLGKMPTGFVFKSGDDGLGWYRDRYDERVLKQGLTVPSSDSLPPAAMPVARALYPEQASAVAWLQAQRHEQFVVAAVEEVVPLSHPGLAGRLGVAVRGYACAQEGSPALLCHAVGFGKTACALALTAEPGDQRTLVVCPPHLVHQWESEAATLVPSRRVARLERGASTVGAADVLIATPEVFAEPSRLGRGASDALRTTPWRLIMDEAHELAARLPVCDALEVLPACHRVLLTATPPLQDMPALAQLARLAGVRVPARAGELQHFLDVCARTSAWTARDVPLESVTVTCRLTRTERVLYYSERQAARWGRAAAHGAQRLLRACTQFSADAAETLESAVARELRRRRSELAAAEEHKARVGRMVAPPGPASEAEEAEVAAVVAEAAEREARAAASLRYFEAATRTARGQPTDEGSCSICLEPLAADGGSTSITTCGHVYHSKCVAAACPFDGGALLERCPLCRTGLTPEDIEPVSQFRECEEPLAQHGLCPDRFGSKIAHILAALRAIHAAEGTGEKVVVMAQWPEVLTRLRRALGEYGVDALAMDGGPGEVQHTLRSFIEGVGPASSVLLLSTAEHCSGLTLTCARHLFLVHPFFADDERQAAAVEQQAVGRLWRRGQRRTVRVHRFVAEKTIEEPISAQHQSTVLTALQILERGSESAER